MKSLIFTLMGLVVALGFNYFIFRFLPFGIALAIMGAGFAANAQESNHKTLIGLIPIVFSFLYPVGIIYTFVVNGWVLGIASIFAAILTYKVSKDTH